MVRPDLAMRDALALVLVLATGCRDGSGAGDEPSEPTSGVPEVGATLEVTMGEPGPATGTTIGTTTGDASGDSTGAPSGDTGSTTHAGADTSGSGSSSEGSSGGASTSSSDGTSSESSASRDTDTSSPGGTSTAGVGSTGDTDTGETTECSFSESFQVVPNGSDWPPPWIPLEGVMLADVQDGRGRLLPVTGPYALARMFVPLGPDCIDVEGTFTFEVSDGQTPGVGLYLRHNGGFLDQTEPPGQGYVAFVQVFGLGTGIGVWRELDGVESILAPFTPVAITPGIVHAVRFRVTQLDADTTRLRTRVWPLEGMEPAYWHVDLTDDTPSLQNVGGGLVIDVWSQLEVGVASDVFVDDIVVGPAP